MADIDIKRESDSMEEPGYTTAELVYWIVGILMIPAVPILMVWFFTPWSGM